MYSPARPLAAHLADVVAGLLLRSPDRAATLRLALAGQACDAAPATCAADFLAAADLATLRMFAAAVMGKRNALRTSAAICEHHVAEPGSDPASAALCRGQAMAYSNAAHHLAEAAAAATGRCDLLTAECEQL